MEQSKTGDRPEPGPLFVVDGNNMAYRAYYALPESIATSAGFPTNALYGFCAMIIKILSDYRPAGVIVAWDSREKTFRHEEFADYKAQRKPMPELLSEQWPYFVELTAAFGFVNLTVPGYEADDILATLARQAEAEQRKTVIVTGDRDALQLVGDHVTVMANTRGVTEVKIYDAAGVEERFGVPPRLIPDLIGLKGDTSDNIPGIPGIGEKTAAQLLAEYGSLEEVLAHAGEVAGVKRRELLAEYHDVAVLSKRLASLEHDAPIDMHAAEILPHEVSREKIEEFFSRFEFNSLVDRVQSLLPEAGPAVDKLTGAPFAVNKLPLPEKDAWADLFDWSGTIGLASQGDTCWLAQADTPGERAGQGAFSVVGVTGSDENVALLRPLLAAAHTVCHDFKSLGLLHQLMPGVGHDTYLAGYLLAPGRREYMLDELSQELGLPVQGDAGGEGPRTAATVIPLAATQEKALREQGMWDLFHDIELPLTRVLIDMEQVGVYLDCYRLGEIAGKAQDQLDELETRIFELAGEHFNLGSPQQLGRVLFDQLGLPRQRKTKTGYSTDAKTLEALRDEHPVVVHLLNHRELSKLMSTYLLALPQVVDEQTGRLHTTFNQTIAATGRLSSSDPNLQNIPVRTALGAQIRECFTAEPGKVLIVADYSQIELRVMAHLSRETTLLEAFSRGEDIHTRTAAEVFGLDEKDVDKTHRNYAKAVNFGIMYGISAFGLSQNLGIDREEAAAYIERYFQRLPRVKAFIEETIVFARRHGYVATMFGRRRPIPELASGNFQERSLGERLAVNSVIQGSAADIIKVAMIRCHERLARAYPGARLVLQVHDELVFEVPEELAEPVVGAVVEEMVAAFPMEPPLGVDVGVGRDWLSAK
jgi:DNA polymerase-1